ncbi:class C sortase [Leucobacter sp. 1207-22]|uniref:class C sortase n=1 Tax=Leucobacter sp. 1207-22 TaxID=2604456 RepID=UPI00406350FD
MNRHAAQSQQLPIAEASQRGARKRRDQQSVASVKKRKRPTASTWITVACWLLGVGVMLYPTTAAWFSQLNQASIIGLYDRELAQTTPDPATQVSEAYRYNESLSAGALLPAGANVAVGSGELSQQETEYREQLSTPSGVMARLRIPSIDVDLPIYHGTDEETLLRGLGHLEGTSLPVGGESTRSVITGHRGLASSRMFTDLDKLKKGDTFTIETFGEVLTYRVRETVVVEPDQTETLHQEAGEDLVTLITCTPLGVNSHRILVTGERISPTPQGDLDAAGQPSGVPGFPWWAVGLGGAVVIAGAYVFWSTTPRRREPRRSAGRAAAIASKNAGAGRAEESAESVADSSANSSAEQVER